MSKSNCRNLGAASVVFMLSLAFPARAEPPVDVCKQYAQNAAGQKTSGQAFRGAVINTGTGAIFGGFFGAPGAGAAVGLGLGAIGGRSSRKAAYQDNYTNAFVDCMTGRVTPR